MGKILKYFFVIFCAIIIAFWALSYKKITPLNAPLNEFSAARAFEDIKQIAKSPHELGSANHEIVKAFLKQRLTQMKIAPQSFVAIGYDTDIKNNSKSNTYSVSARVENIYGIIKGSEQNLPAVMLLSHYDSQTHGAGAADDGSGVAASIETLRAIIANGTPKRDIIIMFTDGEEMGLLGASAFFDEYPAVKKGAPNTQNIPSNIGYVINMETRGDDGPTYMFETGHDNLGLIRAYGVHAKNPNANSFSAAIYSKMPNGTDLTQAIKAGVKGLNFAFTGDENSYHTRLSTPEHLNLGSVQNMGDQVFPTALYLANSNDNDVKGDAIYSDIIGKKLIYYPKSFVWPVTALMIVILAIGAWRLNKNNEFKIVPILRFVASILAIILFSFIFENAVSSLLFNAPHYGRLYNYNFLLIANLLISISLLGIGFNFGKSKLIQYVAYILLIAATIWLYLKKPDIYNIIPSLLALILIWLSNSKIEQTNAQKWFALLLINSIFGLIISFLLPEGTPVIIWPVILSGLLFLWIYWQQKAKNEIWVIVPCIILLAQIFYFGNSLFNALGVDLFGISAALISLAMMALVPFANFENSSLKVRYSSFILAILGVGIFAYAVWDEPNAENPRSIEITRIEDLDNKSAFLIERGGYLSSFGKKALSQNQEKIEHGKNPDLWDGNVYYSKTNPTNNAPITLENKIENGILKIKIPLREQDFSVGLKLKSNIALHNVSIDGVKQFEEIFPNKSVSINRINVKGIDGKSDTLNVEIPITGKGKIDFIIRTKQKQFSQGAQSLLPLADNYMPIYYYGFNQEINRKSIEF